VSKLAELASKYLDIQIDDASTYQEFEDGVRDDSNNRFASVIIEMLDQEDFQEESQFKELMQVVQEYQMDKSIPSIDYDFKPPEEIMEEFGYNPDTGGRLIITRDGQRVEVDDNLELVGPVDADNNPAEGHPAFVPPVSDPRSIVLPGLASPEKEVPLTQLEELVDLDKELYDDLDEQDVYGSPAPLRVAPAPRPAFVKPLETVLAHLPEIGAVEYEVVDVVSTLYAITLVFDPERSKPSFYPKVGLRFTLEFEDGSASEVMSTGCMFSYEDKKFICLGKLDIN